MAICKRLKEFLDKNNIQYNTFKHRVAYTAQKIAATAHISGDLVAKSVMIRADDQIIMCVCPATYRINLDVLKKELKLKKVSLVSEKEFSRLFPDCEPGAMPPFGNLYDIPVYVAESLTADDDIVFNAGNHSELVQMSYNDFEKFVNPIILRISEHMH